MVCRGKFKFKEIRKKDGGSFTNANGQAVNYPSSYQLKLDEKTEKGIEERTFKIADNPENMDLINKLSQYEEYADIVLDFQVQMYTNSTRIIPTAIVTK